MLLEDTVQDHLDMLVLLHALALLRNGYERHEVAHALLEAGEDMLETVH